MSDAMGEGAPVIRNETIRGGDGCFRVAQAANGAWWFLDPDGQPLFLRAVNDVASPAATTPDPVARLRAWGFAALGAGSEPGLRDEGLPFVATVGFVDAGAMLRSGDARLPDVFDPGWADAAAFRAGEVCLPLAGRRELIGWLTDDRLGWAQTGPGGRPGLLQICLSLEPTAAAYHAAWEFVLALHRGRLDSLAKAWGLTLANKEVVRDMTRNDRPILTRGYLRDDARWTQEFARRYFALTAAAIRAHDPHHLVLGCRFGGRAGAAILAECRYPAVDVAWVDVDDLPTLGTGPAVAGEFNWTDPRFLGSPVARRPRGLTTVERMLRRGRAALERCARHPSLVGYAWSQWQDGPAEQPPFASGLVHGNGVEAREHTELLVDLNARLQALRVSAASPSSP